MYITEKFYLPDYFKDYLHLRTPSFGLNGLGELTYYRTYSRIMSDGRQEKWADTVIRVVEGLFSIRKTHMLNNRLPFRDADWTSTAERMAELIFDMKFLPPGRGLYAMGTDYVAERGSMALYNCAATKTGKLSEAAAWLMDCCMCGVGVGFSVEGQADLDNVNRPKHEFPFTIPDSREGWVDSVRTLIDSYTTDVVPRPIFDYSDIRPEGELIKGFGGVSSGYEPLKMLHERIASYLDNYADGKYDRTMTVANIMNAIGACVVAGNVRRSAEIALGSPHDETFLDLKNVYKYPERQPISWMSNNTAVLYYDDDFLKIPDIAERILSNGEPGVMNLKNIQKYARMGEEKEDRATLCNPCGEIPLEDKEVCNLVEIFPTRCGSDVDLIEASKYATLYASTVSLLPTHSEETNAVIARNRRIGVSVSGVSDWIDKSSVAKATRRLREMYKEVEYYNKFYNAQAGVPPSIRFTTVKPSGTISLLAGVSAGMHWPAHTHSIRRIRVGEHSPVVSPLIRAGLFFEPDKYSEKTLVFEFPAWYDNSRSARNVSVWEQASRLVMLQREWANNMVSNTLYFDPEREGKDIASLLSEVLPTAKSVSLLPHTDDGVYEQMPIQGITPERYQEMVDALRPVDWSSFFGSDGKDDAYCSNDGCEIRFAE